MKSSRIEGALVVVLAILTAATIGLQLLNSTDSPSATETALFSVLQFAFALAFAYLLARWSSRREYQDRQREFAIAAYRRIREIRRVADRLEARAMAALGSDTDLHQDLDVMREMAHGLCETARSSAADWADLIGREIETIEQLESRHASQQEPPTEETPRLIDLTRGDDVTRLLDSLPPVLRAEAREDYRQDEHDAALRVLEDAIEERGFLQLRAFWEPDDKFDAPVTEVRVEDPMVVAIGDAGSRVGALLAYTSDGRSVGVVTNPGLWRYDTFLHAILDVMHASRFPAELATIEEPDGDRTYFEVRARPRTAS